MLFSEFVFVWNTLVSYHVMVLLIHRRKVAQSFEHIEKVLESQIVHTQRPVPVLQVQLSARQIQKQHMLKKKEEKLLKSKIGKVHRSELLKTPLRLATRRGLQRLQTLLGLSQVPRDSSKSNSTISSLRNPAFKEPDILDAIFVAIDFEYVDPYCPQVTQLGISTLDTRDILHYYGCPIAGNLISTQHYKVRYQKGPFLFGRTKLASREEMIDILKGIFHMDNNPRKEARNIVLVGHAIDVEMYILKDMGIDLMLAPSVVEVFDTLDLGWEIFRSGLSLDKIVSKVGIKCHLQDFHNAGNDANFTFRAILRLATYRNNVGLLNRNQRLMVEMYQRISI